MIIIGPKGVIPPRARGPVSPEEDVEQLLVQYRSDPEGFVYDVIEAEPDDDQAMILHAIAQPRARVSVRAGHGTGKSAVESWIALWALSCFPDVRVPCTAPSAHQLYDILWSELSKWRGSMNAIFSQRLRQTQDMLVVKGNERNQFAVARTSRRDQPEALQGYHADTVVFIVDEASGVEENVFEVIEGVGATEDARVIMVGNPTRAEGYFFRSHTKDRDMWTCIHMSSERSRFVDKKWAEEMAQKYGKNSNVYRVRVLGEFPTQSDDTLIPIDWCTSALGRDIQSPVAMRRIAGLDVARFGDDTNGLVVRDGPCITRLDEWGQCDLMQTCGKVVQAYRDDRAFDTVYVDVIGLGSGVVDRLREMGVPCVGVNVAESASVPQQERFPRLRDQLWWSVREWFEARACRIDPGLKLADRLIAECSCIRYEITSGGKLKVEGKDELKKRGIASPNLADALCMTFAPGKEVQMVAGDSPKARPVRIVSSKGWT